jgi:cob(I)alamin adenosyltransferase
MNAHQERAEQMHNARAAYRRGEISLSDLLWYAVLTLKYVLRLSR